MDINMTPREFLLKLMVAIMLITVGTSLLATAILKKNGGFLWCGIAVFSVFLTMFIPLVVLSILPDDDGCPLYRYSDDDYKTAIVILSIITSVAAASGISHYVTEYIWI